MMEYDNIRRPTTDAQHSEYALAGSLVGTTWDFGDERRTVTKISQKEEKHENQIANYPVLHFDLGRDMTLSQFRKFVNKDIEPAGNTAAEIADRI